MPQIGWLEILIIVSIAIIVIGPKDFPIMLKKVGSWIGSAKRYFSNIQNEITTLETEDYSIEKDEKKSLEKTIDILKSNGLILVVSFQSLEDRIVKDFFNHNSGKRWRSSRHYPELPDKLATQLKIITKKPILPSASEILENPRSRSAKLRVAQKI